MTILLTCALYAITNIVCIPYQYILLNFIDFYLTEKQSPKSNWLKNDDHTY